MYPELGGAAHGAKRSFIHKELFEPGSRPLSHFFHNISYPNETAFKQMPSWWRGVKAVSKLRPLWEKNHASSRIIAAHFSPIMIEGALVLPPTTRRSEE